MVHPSHWQDTDTINLIHYYSSDGSSLSLTRYHQPQSLLFIRWFSPLTDQITSVWVIISHQMVLPWPDTICLSHYYSSHSSALFLTRYHQPQFFIVHQMVHPSHWSDSISLSHYLSYMVKPSHRQYTISLSHFLSYMVQSYYWTDTISLIHYHSSHGSALFLTRYYQPQLLY